MKCCLINFGSSKCFLCDEVFIEMLINRPCFGQCEKRSLVKWFVFLAAQL